MGSSDIRGKLLFILNFDLRFKDYRRSDLRIISLSAICRHNLAKFVSSLVYVFSMGLSM